MASVYLDGDFLGTAEQLSALVEPLAVSPGSHFLQLVAPGFEPHEERFEVAEGEVAEVLATLEPDGG
jgi:hypothetical protein